jgi:hypothetical protein
MALAKRSATNANEGEGSRTAARRYNEAVRATVRSGTVGTKAREAAKALDGPEGKELRRAEEQAKKRGTSAKTGVKTGAAKNVAKTVTAKTR